MGQQSEIQRPRSALHAGDFTEDSEAARDRIQDSPCDSLHKSSRSFNGLLGTSPTTSWYTPSIPASRRLQYSPQLVSADSPLAPLDRRSTRNRAPSLSSFSSSYILTAPTSPLVQQYNNTDIDFSFGDYPGSPGKSNRRHTLPPHALQSLPRWPTMSQAARQPQSLHREGSFPYHTHQRRRSSISSRSLQISSSPQSPAYSRSRGLSYSSEASPLQNSSMVGSYEESILRGRMSTAPSIPLDFTAQIGALGKGNCKPKHPAHVTVPFPAVFYSWNGATGGAQSVRDDEPSPYVGHIDLEHSLPPAEPKDSRRERNQGFNLDNLNDNGFIAAQEHGRNDITIGWGKSEKRKRTAPSPKAPLGGSYRIPQQGQLQIIIKNPNKTAVKLFLVPYDLEGMEMGTKTFIRQRCYSAGPMVDKPMMTSATSESRSNPAWQDKQRKPALRYLVHLNICSPSKGRFYLYHQIRVVFANRVPDNVETLQTEIQLPEPRYSPWRDDRESPMDAKHTTASSFSRRDSEFGLTLSNFDIPDDGPPKPFHTGFKFPFQHGSPTPPIPAVPFNPFSSPSLSPELFRNPETTDTSRPTTSSSGLHSPLSDKATRLATNNNNNNNGRPMSFHSVSSHSSDSYSKLSKGDAGYGGTFGRPDTPEQGEGLLARKLKALGVQLEAGLGEFAA